MTKEKVVELNSYSNCQQEEGKAMQARAKARQREVRKRHQQKAKTINRRLRNTNRKLTHNKEFHENVRAARKKQREARERHLMKTRAIKQKLDVIHRRQKLRKLGQITNKSKSSNSTEQNFPEERVKRRTFAGFRNRDLSWLSLRGKGRKAHPISHRRSQSVVNKTKNTGGKSDDE